MLSEKLRHVSERVGMMSLRERVFIFVAAAIVMLALVQTFIIDAGQLRQQRANERLKMADATLVQIGQQQQLLAGQAGRDPDRAARDALALAAGRLAELSAELETRTRSLVPPERMNLVLKNVVREQGGIRVVGFKTLSPQAVALPEAVDGALKDSFQYPLEGYSDPLRPKGRVESYAPPGFYRHGFEITVSGRYADLVAYLERLEALPWRLSWIEATLDATARPELTLTLTVHTLSLEEAWLRV